jgi:hypothetical protein
MQVSPLDSQFAIEPDSGGETVTQQPGGMTITAAPAPGLQAQAAPQAVPQATPTTSPDDSMFVSEDTPPLDAKLYAPGLKPYLPLIQQAAEKYGVPPQLVAGVIQQESGGNPKAVSKTGAQGLMQIEPGTGKDLGLKDAFDPAQNIDAGTKYLKQLYEQTADPATKKGDWQKTLIGYNAGPGVLQDPIAAAEGFFGARDYADKVLANYQNFGGDPAALNLDKGGIGEALLNGVTLGQLPRIKSGIDASVGGLLNELDPTTGPNGEPNTFHNIFAEDMGTAQNPGQMAQGIENFAQAHPVLSGVSTALGSMVPAAIGGAGANALLRAAPVVGPMLAGDASAGGNLIARLLRGSASGAAQGAIGGAITSPLNNGPQGATPGQDTAAGAAMGAGLGAIAPGLGAAYNGIKNAIFNPGDLTPAEVALAQKAENTHGIDIGTGNLLGYQPASPVQRQQLTNAALKAVGAEPPANGVANEAYVADTENKLGQDVGTAAAKLPIAHSGDIGQELNSAFEELYGGKIPDQAETGDAAAVQRSPGRERIRQIANMLNQTATNSQDRGDGRLVPGTVISKLLSPGGAVRQMQDSKISQISDIGDRIADLLQDAQKQTAQLSGKEGTPDLQALTEAKAKLRSFQAVKTALGQDQTNYTVDPNTLAKAVMNDTGSNYAKYTPKLKEVAEIAKNFLSGAKTANRPANKLIPDSILGGSLAAGGGALGYLTGDPLLGGIVAGTGAVKGALDAAAPYVRNTTGFRNNLMSRAQGLGATLRPYGTGQVPDVRNALLRALAGAGALQTENK